MSEKYVHLTKFPDCYIVDVVFEGTNREVTEFYSVPESFDGEVLLSCYITKRTFTKETDGEEIIVSKGVSPESSEKKAHEEALKFAKIRAKDLERKILDFTSNPISVLE